jgi:hypothetical protein
MSNVTTWVAEKIAESEKRLRILDRTPDDFLVVGANNGYRFLVAILGIHDVVQITHVQPLFTVVNKPQLVVNVPSKALWSGAAIDFVHSVPASFGTMGDIARAAETRAAESYRDKNMGFFINALEQHSNVSKVSYVYDSVLQVDREVGANVIVAVIDAYNMSAEDVRNARARVGNFDVAVKSTSYGSITGQAEAAAESMCAKAVKFAGLMRLLAR